MKNIRKLSVFEVFWEEFEDIARNYIIVTFWIFLNQIKNKFGCIHYQLRSICFII